MKLLPKHTPCYGLNTIQKVLNYNKLYTTTRASCVLIYKNVYAMGKVRIKISHSIYKPF
jgi:hypothetical protein